MTVIRFLCGHFLFTFLFPCVAVFDQNSKKPILKGHCLMKATTRSEKRAAIAALTKAGLAPGDIISITGYNRQLVYEWAERTQNDEPLEDRPRAGRPSKLTRRATQYILQSTIGKRRRSVRVVKRDLERRHLASVDPSTVSRFLHKAGAHPFRPTKVPKLTSHHEDRRYRFATKYQHHDWQLCVFVDEKKFELYCNPNKKNDIVWAYSIDQVPGWEKMQHSPSVHLWGGISIHGATPLVTITGTLDGEAYRKLLEDNYLPAIQELFEDDDPYLVQDNAPPHTSHLVSDWLKENDLNFIPASDWPSYSPDLNPIENLWGWIQHKCNERKIRTAKNLEKFIRNLWCSLTPEFLSPYILSMDNRLKLCRQLKGKAIKVY